MTPLQFVGRRSFLRNTVFGAIGASPLALLPLTGNGSPFINKDFPFADDDINLIRPVEGYSPQIGILVSMMNWIRQSVIRATANLTQKQLDFQTDDKSNSIGALLLHLAATDVVYQDMTFNGQKRGFSEANKAKWEVPMELGEAARKKIKGHNLQYYLDELQQVRERTLAEFKKRDDKWFAEVDPSFFDKKPTNNFCKWFHVCEHEANHRGQITMIRKRLPGNENENA